MTPLVPSVRIAVVGAGLVGRQLLAAIDRTEGARLVAVCDTDPGKATRVGSTWRVPGFADAPALFAVGPAVDAVAVAVPNDHHVEVVSAALGHGLHVCVEKPLAPTAGDAERLTDQADRAQRLLFTAFHRRYNRNLPAFLDRLAGRSIDRLELWYQERIADHLGDTPWCLDPAVCGGGCVIDNGPNALDLVATILGEWPTVAAARLHGEPRAERAAVLRLSSARCPEITVHLDWDLDGERKAVAAMVDGHRVECDLLAGFPEHKSSLVHEYEGIVGDFVARIAAADCHDEAGYRAARLVDDIYATGAAPRIHGSPVGKAPGAAS